MPHTIKEVAKFAEVSVSTVSRVINNSGYVGEKTRQKILEAMRTLNFEPSSIARGLVSGRTSTIGLLLPDVANPFFAEVARGTEEAAIKKGFTVILCNTDWSLEREKMYLNVLKGRAVEGVIIIGNRSPERDLIQELAPVPCVFVDRKVVSHESYIWVDHERGAQLATEKLLSSGCTSIAHISGPRKSTSARARLSGYLKAMKAAHLQSNVLPGDFRFAGGYEAAKELFAREEPPDGIFAANDMMAIGVIQAANELGVKVPTDVSIIGYDDIDMAKCISPALTTIRQPAHEMGKAAFTLFENHSMDMKIEFEAKLIERKSTR